MSRGELFHRETLFIISLVTLILSIILCIRGIFSIQPNKLCTTKLDKDDEDSSNSNDTTAPTKQNCNDSIGSCATQSIGSQTSQNSDFSLKRVMSSNNGTASSSMGSIALAVTPSSSSIASVNNSKSSCMSAPIASSSSETSSIESINNNNNNNGNISTKSKSNIKKKSVKKSGKDDNSNVAANESETIRLMKRRQGRVEMREQRVFYYRLVSLSIVIFCVLSGICICLSYASQMLSNETNNMTLAKLASYLQLLFLFCHFFGQVLVYTLFSGRIYFQLNRASKKKLVPFLCSVVTLLVFAIIATLMDFFIVFDQLFGYTSNNNSGNSEEWIHWIILNLFHIVYLIFIIYRAREFVYRLMSEQVKNKERRIRKRRKLKAKMHLNSSTANMNTINEMDEIIVNSPLKLYSSMSNLETNLTPIRKVSDIINESKPDTTDETNLNSLHLNTNITPNNTVHEQLESTETEKNEDNNENNSNNGTNTNHFKECQSGSSTPNNSHSALIEANIDSMSPNTKEESNNHSIHSLNDTENDTERTYHISLSLPSYHYDFSQQNRSNLNFFNDSDFQEKIEFEMKQSAELLARTSSLALFMIIVLVFVLIMSLLDLLIFEKNENSADLSLILIEFEVIIDTLCCLMMFGFATFEYDCLCKCKFARSLQCFGVKTKHAKKRDKKQHSTPNNAKNKFKSEREKKWKHHSRYGTTSIDDGCKFGCHFICYTMCYSLASRHMRMQSNYHEK